VCAVDIVTLCDQPHTASKRHRLEYVVFIFNFCDAVRPAHPPAAILLITGRYRYGAIPTSALRHRHTVALK
jgi:hypothetical protein